MIKLTISPRLYANETHEYFVSTILGNASDHVSPVLPLLGVYVVNSLKHAGLVHTVCLADGTCSCALAKVFCCTHIEAVSLIHLAVSAALHLIGEMMPPTTDTYLWKELISWGALHAREQPPLPGSLDHLVTSFPGSSQQVCRRLRAWAGCTVGHAVCLLSVSLLCTHVLSDAIMHLMLHSLCGKP
jgi:hypothetical protein